MNKFIASTWLGLICLGLCLFSCKTSNEVPPPPEPISLTKPRVPEWHKNATMYEVNIRQFSPEGTFQAFQKDLPRLKEMGIDILWFMPINPISVKNRKGTLGSYYAVADYKAVNPDYGTMEDFKALVKAIHDAGMYVIIDWVPNHTGWDHHWITEHPDWYTKDADGNITDPIDPGTGKSWGWTDVADLNYDKVEMRQEMISDMAFWIKDVGIDGFRCDVAHNVPVDFWTTATDSLYTIKEVFMLAEAESADLRNTGSFVVDYGWEFHHLMNAIAKGGSDGHEAKNANDIEAYLKRKAEANTAGYSLHFTSNHDENSWSGTVMERMGDAHQTFAILAATFDGMPLIYNGQEAPLKKRLEFFEKDEIDWGDYSYADFYKKLFTLKHKNLALWNGEHGGKLVRIPTAKSEEVFAYYRTNEGDRVLVVLNLTNEAQEISLQGEGYADRYTEIFSGEQTDIDTGTKFELGAWGYKVFSN